MKTTRIRLIFGVLLAAWLGACGGDANDDGDDDGDNNGSGAPTISEVDFPVMLRGTGSATVHATVYTNGNSKATVNALAIHGLAETGTVYRNLAAQLFATVGVAERVKRVIAIDLVGHGKSSLPRDLPGPGMGLFGDLTIEDNVSVVTQAIQQLTTRELAPQVIIGHSMGGLAVQAAQEALLASGSSYAKVGIRAAILLAPVPPTGRPWVRPPSADVSALIMTDAMRGAYLGLPTALWIAQAFTNSMGMPAANAPTPEEVESEGYNAVEPVATLLQLLESPEQPLRRPMVRAGAFSAASGTTLTLVSYSEDTLVPASNLPDLYEHLTGDATAKGHAPVVAPDAVHSMFISSPAATVAAIANVF